MKKLVLKKWIFTIAMLQIVSIGMMNSQTINVKTFGAKGDGVNNDYWAIKTAVSKINKQGRGKLIFPKGNYYIGNIKKSKIDEDTMDIKFINCKNVTIEGNNSTIKINGRFNRSRDYPLPNGYGSSSNSVIPIRIENCSNIKIQNLELDGSVNLTTRDSLVGEGGGDGIFIYANSKNIILKNLYIHHFHRDGIQLHDIVGEVCIKNVRSNNNARQGLTIGGGKNIKCVNSEFSSNGKTDGKYLPHSPMAGLDVEEVVPITNISFTNCMFLNNFGFQVVASGNPGKSKGLKFDKCVIKDNSDGYGHYLNGLGLYFDETSVTNSKITGTINLSISGANPKHSIQIKNNKIESGSIALYCTDIDMAVNVENNSFTMLPNSVYTQNAGDAANSFIYVGDSKLTFKRNKIFFDETMPAPDPLKRRIVCRLLTLEQIINNQWKFKVNQNPKPGYTYYVLYCPENSGESDLLLNNINKWIFDSCKK